MQLVQQVLCFLVKESFLPLVLLISLSSSAAEEKLNPKHVEDITSRILLVGLQDVDEDQIGKWRKKGMKKPELAGSMDSLILKHKNRVERYNKRLVEIAKNHWTLNDSIEFRPLADFEDLSKSSKKYAVLWLRERIPAGFETNPVTNASKVRYLDMPSLYYGRIEKYKKYGTEYVFTLNTGGTEIGAKLLLAMKLMQAHISYIAQTKDKSEFKDFARIQAKENCKKLNGGTILVNETSIARKTTIDQLTSVYTIGSVESFNQSDIEQAILNEDSKIIGFSFLWRIVSSSNSFATQFMRCFIDVGSGEIFSCSGTQLGDYSRTSFREKEFTDLVKCSE